MRTLLLAVAVLTVSACSLTPTQKKLLGFAAGVIVVGTIAAHDDDSDPVLATTEVGDPSIPCRPQPDGSCR